MGQLFSVLCAASWGLSNVYALKAVDDKSIDKFTGLCITLIVNNIINVVILSVFFLSGHAVAVNWQGLLSFSIGGFLNSFAGRGVLFISISMIGASRAGILKIVSPLFAIFAGVVILNETMSKLAWIGTTIVLLGIFYISLETVRESKRRQAEREASTTIVNSSISVSKKGIILGIIAGLFLGSGNVFRKLGVTYIPSSLLGVSIGSLIALTAALILQIVTGRIKTLLPAIKKINKSYILAGVYTSMALYTLFLALKYIPISMANSITASEPLFTIMGSLVLLGKKEVLTVRILFGAAIVVTGIILLILL